MQKGAVAAHDPSMHATVIVAGRGGRHSLIPISQTVLAPHGADMQSLPVSPQLGPAAGHGPVGVTGAVTIGAAGAPTPAAAMGAARMPAVFVATTTGVIAVGVRGGSAVEAVQATTTTDNASGVQRRIACADSP